VAGIRYSGDGLMLAAPRHRRTIDEEVASFLAGILLERYRALLSARYGFATGTRDGAGLNLSRPLFLSQSSAGTLRALRLLCFGKDATPEDRRRH
jgi:hypothetical protein